MLAFLMGALIFVILIAVLIKNKRTQALINTEEYQNSLREIEQFFIYLQKIKNNYLNYSLKIEIKDRYSELLVFFIQNKYIKINSKEVNDFIGIMNNLDSFVKEFNKNYIQKELTENEILFDNIDEKKLSQKKYF